MPRARAGVTALALLKIDLDNPLAAAFATALPLEALEGNDLVPLGGWGDEESLREPARSAAAKAFRPDMAETSQTPAKKNTQ
jgi:hypothetical protein